MGWLSRFRPAPKLIGSFIIVAALAGLVGVAGLRGLQETQAQPHDITGRTIPAVIHLRAADGAVHEAMRDSRGAILSSTNPTLAGQLRHGAGMIEAEALHEFAAFT